MTLYAVIERRGGRERIREATADEQHALRVADDLQKRHAALGVASSATFSVRRFVPDGTEVPAAA